MMEEEYIGHSAAYEYPTAHNHPPRPIPRGGGGGSTAGGSLNNSTLPSPRSNNIIGSGAGGHHSTQSSTQRQRSMQPTVSSSARRVSQPNAAQHNDPSPPRTVSNATYVELSQLKSEVYTLKKELMTTHLERERMDAEVKLVQTLRADNEALRIQVQDLLTERLRLEERLSQSTMERTAAQDYLQRQLEDNSSVRTQMKTIEEQFHTTRTLALAKESHIRELEDELQQARNRARELQKNLDDLFQEHSNAKALCRQLQTEVGDLRSAHSGQEAMQAELLATIRDLQERSHHAPPPSPPDLTTPVLQELLQEVRSQKALLTQHVQQSTATSTTSNAEVQKLTEMLAASEQGRSLLITENELLRRKCGL